MKIGVMSDSHDNLNNVRKAVSIFKEKKVEFAVHLGDYSSPSMIQLLDGLKIRGIFGNNDGDKFRIMSKFDEIDGNVMENFWNSKKIG